MPAPACRPQVTKKPAGKAKGDDGATPGSPAQSPSPQTAGSNGHDLGAHLAILNAANATLFIHIVLVMAYRNIYTLVSSDTLRCTTCWPTC